ncbi:hypothetical protein [Roseimicrobium gellanilyticum]|nr:hypothetical protein [Roseimicrobium gellanilyticum]
MSETITFTIPLEEPDECEDYAEQCRNIVQVQVSEKTNGMWRRVPNASNHMVNLILSREGTIGLATALLRTAHQPTPSPIFLEMLPSSPGHAVERFGVFMHPDSCRLNIGLHDFGDIHTTLDAQNDSTGAAG